MTTTAPAHKRSTLTPEEVLARKARHRVESIAPLWSAALADATGDDVDGEAVADDLELSGLTVERFREFCRQARERAKLRVIASNRAAAEAEMSRAKAEQDAANARSAELIAEAESIRSAAGTKVFRAKDAMQAVSKAEDGLRTTIPKELTGVRDEAAKRADRAAQELRIAETNLRRDQEDLDSYSKGYSRMCDDAGGEKHLRSDQATGFRDGIAQRQRIVDGLKQQVASLTKANEVAQGAFQRAQAELDRVLRGEPAEELAAE